MNTTTVFTYFEPVAALNKHDQLREISVWKASWERYGWRPQILTHEYVERSRDWRDLTASVARLPSVNAPGYDVNCYLRWLALANAGGGLMTDYDVVNLGFTPAMLEHEVSPQRFFAGPVPAMVYATADGARGLFNECASYQLVPSDTYHGTPHTSDMYIFEKHGHGIGEHRLCEDAESRATNPILLHCSHLSLAAIGETCPRWQFMKTVMGFVSPDPELALKLDSRHAR